MPLLSFKCRICKCFQEHEVLQEFSGFGLVVQCHGCGVMGVEMKINARVNPSDTPKVGS